ncbi:hypothetical protein DFJ73DRAFT_762431 [Zopfochytrium polystomum]|nr:hypothetical protein DFJ73DRAFT_762431 [Zopfochytrium polystomum]
MEVEQLRFQNQYNFAICDKKGLNGIELCSSSVVMAQPNLCTDPEPSRGAAVIAISPLKEKVLQPASGREWGALGLGAAIQEEHQNGGKKGKEKICLCWKGKKKKITVAPKTTLQIQMTAIVGGDAQFGDATGNFAKPL